VDEGLVATLLDEDQRCTAKPMVAPAAARTNMMMTTSAT
jgi:hypothetical protein